MKSPVAYVCATNLQAHQDGRKPDFVSREFDSWPLAERYYNQLCKEWPPESVILIVSLDNRPKMIKNYLVPVWRAI